MVLSNIPAGALIVNAAGIPLGTVTGPGEVHWPRRSCRSCTSFLPANFNGDFQLTITASATELVQGLLGDNTTAIGTSTLDVHVIGVADPANLVAVPVTATEDMTIALGSAVTASLADPDGSELIYFVISGLPVWWFPRRGPILAEAGKYRQRTWLRSAFQPRPISQATMWRTMRQLSTSGLSPKKMMATKPACRCHCPFRFCQLWMAQHSSLPLVSLKTTTFLANVVPAAMADADGSESVVS